MPDEAREFVRKRYLTVTDEEDGLSIKVYPLNYRVMEEHADAVALLLQAAGKLEAAELVSKIEDGDAKALWLLLAPLAGRTIMKLINDSCVPTLAECYASPDVVAEAAAKWLQLSFLRRGSYTRVINAAGSLAEAATGEKVDLHSRLRSLLTSVTAGVKSTGANGGTVTRNADGQSPSSPRADKPPESSLTSSEQSS